jgi:hypothetical protein
MTLVEVVGDGAIVEVGKEDGIHQVAEMFRKILIVRYSVVRIDRRIS